MKLRYLGGRYQGRTLDLKPDGFGIGRDADNDLVLEDEGASRRHCRVYRENDEWFIEDLKSTNGVRVNGKRIDRVSVLKPGDRIGICRQLLLFSDDTGIVDPAALHVESIPRDAMGGVGPGPEPPRVESASFPWFRAVLVFLLLGAGIAGLIAAFRTPLDGGDREATQAAASTAPAESAISKADAAASIAPGASKVLEPPKNPLPPISLAPGAPSAPPVSKEAGATEKVAVPKNGAAAAGGAPAPRPPVAAILGVVESKPAGASVEIDGEQVGKTPLVLRGLAPGRHRVRLVLDGYEPLVRQILVPGALPTAPYELRLRPGMLLVESAPPGAAVLKGTQVLGRTPVVLRGLPAGKQELRLVALGFVPQTVRAEVNPIRGERLRVELKSALGAMAVATRPAGCGVVVDGDPKGTTVPSGKGGGISAPLNVPGLVQGEHVVSVRHPLAGVQTRKVSVSAGQTARLTLGFWVPDTRVKLVNGGERFGMLVRREPNGDVLLAETPLQTRRYAKAQVAGVGPLSKKAARQLAARFAAGVGRRSGATAGASAGPTLFGDDIVGPPARAQRGAAKEAQTAGREGGPGAPERQAGQDTFTVAELERLFRMTSGIELKRRLTGRELTIRGVPTGDSETAGRCRVDFGKRIQCYFPPEEFKDVRTRVRVARARREAIIVTGRCVAYHITGLVLEGCRLQADDDAGQQAR
ncbi:MAG: PEGA domain-containing protein [Kiritimatiellaeota bacterium]|nr:PEGA domain-containing protein [Kiritimatiellota bacterium]